MKRAASSHSEAARMDPQHAPTDPNLPVPIGFVLDGRSLDDLDRELQQAGIPPGERAQVVAHIRRTEAQRADRDHREDQRSEGADPVDL